MLTSIDILAAPEQNSFILHYAYASWRDVARRKYSCPLVDEAKKVISASASASERKEASDAVHACFVLNFDERAFVVAVTDDEEKIKAFFSHNLLVRSRFNFA